MIRAVAPAINATFHGPLQMRLIPLAHFALFSGPTRLFFFALFVPFAAQPFVERWALDVRRPVSVVSLISGSTRGSSFAFFVPFAA